MQTGVCTDHCNYGALGESSFLCRFICHINKGISSTYRGWWQQEKFEKINELWQCCTWGAKSVAISSGLCWHRVWRYERGRWREASDCCRLWSYILLLSYPVTSPGYCACDLLYCSCPWRFWLKMFQWIKHFFPWKMRTPSRKILPFLCIWINAWSG